MERPCFLIVDREYAGSISSRKLVIESAKLNVITAYDPDEALHALRRFPNVDGVVVNADMAESADCERLIAQLRAIVPGIAIIITTTGGYRRCGHQEYYVDSLDPTTLLDCLRSLKKRVTAEIVKHDDELRD